MNFFCQSLFYKNDFLSCLMTAWCSLFKIHTLAAHAKTQLFLFIFKVKQKLFTAPDEFPRWPYSEFLWSGTKEFFSSYIYHLLYIIFNNKLNRMYGNINVWMASRQHFLNLFQDQTDQGRNIFCPGSHKLNARCPWHL